MEWVSLLPLNHHQLNFCPVTKQGNNADSDRHVLNNHCCREMYIRVTTSL